MSITQLGGSKYGSNAYREELRIKGASATNSKDSGHKDKEKPLDVLYIQAMDEDHTECKNNARKSLRDKANYGEINVKNLEGGTKEEKMQKLKIVLHNLRLEGKYNNNTQVIFSFNPGEADGELDIRRNSRKEKAADNKWGLDELVAVVRGGEQAGMYKANSDFEGTIHIFGHDPEKIGIEIVKKYGNVLMHANGKSNLDYNHVYMIDKIAESARRISGNSAESRAASMRDAL